MFYEYFWLILGILAFSGVAGALWFGWRLPQKDALSMTQHKRALRMLLEDPRLHLKNASTCAVRGHTDCFLWVSPSGLCILWLKAPSRSQETEASGPLNVPTAVQGWLTCWVDPKYWDRPLAQMCALRDALMGQGPWARVAKEHGLVLTQSPAGLPRLQSELQNSSLQVEATGQGLWVQARVDPSLHALPGKGSSGNPVLDLCMDTQGVPPDLVTPILSLLHEQGGRCQNGALETTWPGGLGELLGALSQVLAHNQGKS